MDKYQKLKAVQGLIMSLDEQIYRHDHIPNYPPLAINDNNVLVTQYFNAIIKFLVEGDNAKIAS